MTSLLPSSFICRALHILVLTLAITTAIVWLSQQFGNPRTVPVDVPLFLGQSLHIHITPGFSRSDLEPAAAGGAGIRRVPNSIPWIRVWYREGRGAVGTLLTTFSLPTWPTTQMVAAILLAWLGLLIFPAAGRTARRGHGAGRMRERPVPVRRSDSLGR